MENKNLARFFKCTICQACFKSRPSLRRHAIVHTDIRLFQCIYCGKTYKYKHGMERHMKRYHPKEWMASLWLYTLYEAKDTIEEGKTPETTVEKRVEDSFDAGYYLNLEDSDKENKNESKITVKTPSKFIVKINAKTNAKNTEKDIKTVNFNDILIFTSPFPDPSQV